MGLGMGRQTWGAPAGHFPHPKKCLLSSDETGTLWKSSGKQRNSDCRDKPRPAATRGFSCLGANSRLGTRVFHMCPQTAAGQFRQA